MNTRIARKVLNRTPFVRILSPGWRLPQSPSGYRWPPYRVSTVQRAMRVHDRWLDRMFARPRALDL